MTVLEAAYRILAQASLQGNLQANAGAEPVADGSEYTGGHSERSAGS